MPQQLHLEYFVKLLSFCFKVDVARFENVQRPQERWLLATRSISMERKKVKGGLYLTFMIFNIMKDIVKMNEYLLFTLSHKRKGPFMKLLSTFGTSNR